MNNQDIIIEANTNRYESGKIVNDYMNTYYHRIRTKKAIKMLLKGIKNNLNDNTESVHILEIAGSTGIVSSYLSNKGYQVTLADISQNALGIAKKRNPQITTVSMDASTIFPFNDNSFEAIYAGDIIEHIFDTRLFLHECYRCLCPGGVIVITTPNLATIQDRIMFLFGKSPRQIDPIHEYLFLHIRPFTYSKLRQAMSLAGFGDFHIATNIIRISIRGRNYDSIIAGKLFPSLGKSLIVSASSIVKR